MDGISLLLAGMMFLAVFGALAMVFGVDSRDDYVDDRVRASRG